MNKFFEIAFDGVILFMIFYNGYWLLKHFT
jgi:hypothetical protein